MYFRGTGLKQWQDSTACVEFVDKVTVNGFTSLITKIKVHFHGRRVQAYSNDLQQILYSSFAKLNY